RGDQAGRASPDRERGTEEEGRDDELVQGREGHRRDRDAIAREVPDVLARDRDGRPQLAHQNRLSIPVRRAEVSSAAKTAATVGTKPKRSHSATPITTKFNEAGRMFAAPGPKSGTSRDAGVRKTASSEPRTCSVRSAVPGPQRSVESHMYIA